MDLSLPPEAAPAPALFDIGSVLMNPAGMQAILDFGSMMAKSAVTIPRHLQGKAPDCTAIVLQAAQWRMNPFAVAQKTFVSPGGALSYEAQLINAVIINCGALEGRPEYAFLGEWDRILGRVKEVTSTKDNGGGGKYYVADWNKADEKDLGVIVSCRLRGESRDRQITVMMSQAYPRFSTQWATDPQQQICYLALRKFSRRYVPDAILGVYTRDELAESTVVHMGDAEEVGARPPPPSAPPPPPAGPPAWPAEKFAEKLPRWTRAVAEGHKTTDDILTMARSVGTLNAEQEKTIRAMKKAKPAPEQEAVDVESREVHSAPPPLDDPFVNAYNETEGGAA